MEKPKIYGLDHDFSEIIGERLCGCFAHYDLAKENGYDIISSPQVFNEEGIYEVTFISCHKKETPALFYFWKSKELPRWNRGLVCSIYDKEGNADAIIKFSERSEFL